ncbi:hypothetical protein SAMN04488040_1276 [Sulfitobacter marinus]|uniref:DUF2125 domain-containing protein n=1 Tax=Sulfitobacter marinus TaxID=394264 RepID=A0A1I6RIX2_9RHOB|nr:DUF2125 domain-containing protein [Sulfitobacter marinus]SFS64679.1 hypothetical protein SAMN04488040_1276 [Sulfitobacter marinus]
MGKLVGILVIVAVFWCGWWALASAGMQRGISKWLDVRRSLGWQADVGGIEKQGFPLRLHAQLNDVAIADPNTGVAARMNQLDISAPTYWPGYVTVALPETPITLVTPDLRATLSAKSAAADLRLRPGRALQLQSLGLSGGAWSLDTATDNIVAADTVDLTMAQQATNTPVYALKLNADNLVPGSLARSFIGLSNDWPAVFDLFTADLMVTFDRVWNRRALEQHRPQPRAIDLRRAHFTWGDIEILATGDLTVDEVGLISGALSVKAENWPALLDMVESAGYLPPNMRPQAEQMLKGLAQMAGKTTGLDLTLSFQEGRMSMGFIPLGRAPRVILR